MQLCDINAIVETALEVLSYALKANGTQVSVVLDQASPQVMGDFDQLAHVFSNLIINAGHALSEKGADGRITLQTRLKNGLVEVKIANNGHGIPEDLQSRFFEPFFTTKDVGEGTGIGLAFSHRNVNGHEGTLTLRSKPATCTQLFVTLSPSQGIAKENAPICLQNDGVLTALVLDDKAGVARVISDILAGKGFHVTTMTDPNAALRLPGKDGLAALRDLRAESHVPVMMLTAAGDVVDKILGLEFSADDYLMKPVDLRELQARIKADLRRSEICLTSALMGPNRVIC